MITSTESPSTEATIERITVITTSPSTEGVTSELTSQLTTEETTEAFITTPDIEKPIATSEFASTHVTTETTSQQNQSCFLRSTLYSYHQSTKYFSRNNFDKLT